MLKRIVSVGAVMAGLLALMTPAAHADTPTTNHELGRQYGNVFRATLTENADGSGNWIKVYGSSPCSATITDRDNVIRVVPPGWNDAISRVYDSAACLTKLYLNGGADPDDTQTGWIDGGSAGVYVGPNWDNKASSFALS
ncbi:MULTISPECIES: hypothetical protein [unclassified Saccharothrix]|uniref:hypothetical protein n=1 Tax=unclassified Saccharothrix TaxID=2593673 RepID=UPI00307E4457